MAYVYGAPTDIQEIIYNSSSATTNKLIYDFVYQDAKVSLSTVVGQIYSNVGSTVGSTFSMSVLASQAWYTVDTTNTTNYRLREGYYIDMTPVLSSGTAIAIRREFFDVVYKQLLPVLNEDHFEEVDSLLDSELPSGETTFQKWITASWREIRASIRARGNRPALMLDSFQLFIPHKNLALAMLYKSLMKQADDQYWRLYVEHKTEFHRTFAEAMQFAKYDTVEDGRISEAPTNLAQKTFRR